MDFSKLLSRDALVHAVAGTIGGAITMGSFYPLEIVRTYIQLDPRFSKSTSSIECAKQLIEEEGLPVLYKGVGNTLFSLACSNFIYFYTNEALKIFVGKLQRRYGKTGLLANETVLHLGIATVAGVVNVMTTCPLWVVNTRLKVQHKKSVGTSAETEKEAYIEGVVDGIQTIAKEEGVSALWSGATASLWLVSNPTILFVLYDSMRKALIRVRKTTELSSLEFFLLGAISKSISTIVTYPLQLAQYRMRNNGKEEQSPQKEKFGHLFSCLVYILKNEGPLGLFRGLNVKLLQTVLMTAFHFLFYEKIMSVIFSLLGIKK